MSALGFRASLHTAHCTPPTVLLRLRRRTVRKGFAFPAGPFFLFSEATPQVRRLSLPEFIHCRDGKAEPYRTVRRQSRCRASISKALPHCAAAEPLSRLDQQGLKVCLNSLCGGKAAMSSKQCAVCRAVSRSAKAACYQYFCLLPTAHCRL